MSLFKKIFIIKLTDKLEIIISSNKYKPIKYYSNNKGYNNKFINNKFKNNSFCCRKNNNNYISSSSNNNSKKC